MKAKISLITLGVFDMDASLIFYRDVLGFPIENYKPGDNIVFFKMEGTWLSLYPQDKLAEDATVTSKKFGFPGFTLTHNLGSKEEVDQVYSEACSRGARSVKPPENVVWGGYSGYIADPDGYLWEIAYNPFTDLT